jgi:hypothetical protein
VNEKAKKKGIIFEISTIPNAKKPSITKESGKIKVRVREPPDKGKANRAVAAALQKHFGRCRIISGEKSRKKTIFALDTDDEQYRSFLNALENETE